MRTIAYCLRLLWWFGAASLPLLINEFYHAYSLAIQCPPYEECYTPGWEHLLLIRGLTAFSALTVWPLFTWYVVVQPWQARAAARRSKAASIANESQQ